MKHYIYYVVSVGWKRDPDRGWEVTFGDAEIQRDHAITTVEEIRKITTDLEVESRGNVRGVTMLSYTLLRVDEP